MRLNIHLDKLKAKLYEILNSAFQFDFYLSPANLRKDWNEIDISEDIEAHSQPKLCQSPEGSMHLL